MPALKGFLDLSKDAHGSIDLLDGGSRGGVVGGLPPGFPAPPDCCGGVWIGLLRLTLCLLLDHLVDQLLLTPWFECAKVSTLLDMWLHWKRHCREVLVLVELEGVISDEMELCLEKDQILEVLYLRMLLLGTDHAGLTRGRRRIITWRCRPHKLSIDASWTL